MVIKPKVMGKSGRSGRKMKKSKIKSKSKRMPQVGEKVERKNDVEKRVGEVKFVGPTEFAPGVWVGVEWEAGGGKHDGMVKGKRYFTSLPGHGSMVKPSSLSVLPTSPSNPKKTNAASKNNSDNVMASSSTTSSSTTSSSTTSTTTSTNPTTPSFITQAPETPTGPTTLESPEPSYLHWDREAILSFLTTSSTSSPGLSPTTLSDLRPNVDGFDMYTLLELREDFELAEEMERLLGIDDPSQGRAVLSAFRALPPPPGEALIASGFFDTRIGTPTLLSEVREAMAEAIATTGKFPLLLDPTNTVQTFLKYSVNVDVNMKALFLAKLASKEWEPSLVQALTHAMQQKVTREPLLWLDLGDSAVDMAQFALPSVFPLPALSPRQLPGDSDAVAALLARYKACTPTMEDNFISHYTPSPSFVVVATSALPDSTISQSLSDPASDLLTHFTPLRIVIDNPLPSSSTPPPTPVCIGCRSPDDYLLRPY